MKVNDAFLGSVFLGLSLLILWSVRSLPKIPGQDVGPSAFPSLLASLLAICSVLLVIRGIRERRLQPFFQAGAWTGSWPHVRSFLIVIGGLLFYALSSEYLGYFLCAPIILVSLFLSLGVSAAKALPLAALATLGAHTVFYKMLLVPLPWGLLPVLW